MIVKGYLNCCIYLKDLLKKNAHSESGPILHIGCTEEVIVGKGTEKT